MPALRWGIASSGLISHDFTQAIKMVGGDNQVVAVAARKVESAEAFAKLFDIPKAYGGYSELASDKDIDIVYVGTIHPAHHEIAKMMLNAGKHVLCEKPMTLNVRDTTELLQLAKEKNVFLMEGLWSKFFPVYKQIRSEIQSGAIGEVKHVQASFGVPMFDVPRMKENKLGGGAIVDLGCYPVTLSCMVFGERPERIHASSTLRDGVDMSTAATLHYKNGGTAQINCSLLCPLENSGVICGTKGMLKIPPNFWAPTQLITPSKTHEYPLPEAPMKMKFPNSEGLMYEVECVGECIAKGVKECAVMTHDMTLMNVEILDEIRRQIGVVYDADKV